MKTMNGNNISSIRPGIRPLPYFSMVTDAEERYLAHILRREFTGKIGRRLTGHHLKGLRHDFIVSFVEKHKQKYPYFLRTDITKFYPSIRHRDLLVGVQLAYRDLLGLKYVPRSFKAKYVGRLLDWTKSLPLIKGIPLSSPVSSIAAPLMLIPMWMELKRLFPIPFIVYMDDVLVLAESSVQCMDVFAFLENYLSSNYNLELNIQKTQSGRFSRDNVDFCGWHFAGGYTTISNEKVEAFKARVNKEVARCRNIDSRAFIKRINRKTDGFGNYYKHGNVAKQFEALDIHTRRLVRQWLCRKENTRQCTNRQLENIGLHSLCKLYEQAQEKKGKRAGVIRPMLKPRYNPAPIQQPVNHEMQEHIVKLLEKAQAQLTELLSIQRKQLTLIQDLAMLP